MSSKEHIQLGWVVRWALSTPPGHPAAGRCVRVVPVLPLLLCTRPARARPSIGVKAPLPLRASSRGVLPGAPNALSVSSVFHPRLSLVAHSSSSRQNEIDTIVVPRSPRHRQRIPCGHKRMNRFDAPTRVLSGKPIFYTQRSPSLELLRERGFTAPRDTSLCESMFGRMVVSRQLLVYKEKIHKRAVCLLGTCVTWLPMPYPKIPSARVSQIRSWQGALSHHAFMIRSR
jgi:hypothetical protein